MFTPHKGACCLSDGKLTRNEAKTRGWCKICKQECSAKKERREANG